ncbi:MAG: helicase-exonuclease AddAB subunit AddA [Lachnospiraceae bacterium]
MSISFTPDQYRVIEQRNSNILVSAAAGSGKTAVLVERIVRLITEETHPVDIDRLLIVTFTNAAASEMRERISRALSDKLEEDPTNVHLQKQMTLIHNAQITTIDSFCLFVIRNNFNDIGLDPAFRIADEGELRLLRKDVMAEMLEKQFAEGNPDFYHCVECYSTNGKEKVLEDTIEKLEGFAMSYPFPEQWLQTCREDYAVSTMQQLKQTQWMQEVMIIIRQMAEDCLLMLKEALLLSEQADGPYMYCELLEQEQENLKRITDAADYETTYQLLEEIKFERLPAKKDESVSAFKREQVKNIRTKCKECILDIKSTYFTVSPEQTLADIQACAPAVNKLLDLTLQFMEDMADKKQEKNIIDFGDMEHFALRILLHEEDGKQVPTKTALAYRDYYAEILMDEYQDSNLVQEYLLQSISGESIQHYNRFMVGDVKQSIYKFRLARPELFMNKFNQYDLKDETSKTIRIDLKQNFRSRAEVIDSVNYIFRQIMREELGGIAYDDDAALYQGADYPDNGQQNETELLLIEPDESKELNKKLNKKELEATVIAHRIRELVGTYLVMDASSKTLRTADYRDIVILLRSNNGWDETFRRILTQEGIPTHITSKTGYFSSIEIQSILNYLRILDNPLQDIPLCAVMTSPVIGFTNEDIACIRAWEETRSGHKKRTLYDSMQGYEESGEEETIRVKIHDFKQKLIQYREQTAYIPIHQLLYTLMEELGFYAYMSAMPAGEQRKANMDMLLEKAIDFEQTSYHGLFHFIRYIEQMERYDVDLGEANILNEYANVVRIMSIHKSKGLEFPICIVAGLAKRFNMQDTRQAIITDIDYGIGTDYVNPEERYKTSTLHKAIIANKKRLENLGEELRVLYVALTRAEEKLIMTGVVDDVAKKLTNMSPLLINRNQAIYFTNLSNMGSLLDYIIASLIRHPACAPLLEQSEIVFEPCNLMRGTEPKMQIKVCRAQELVIEEVHTQIHRDSLRQQLENFHTPKTQETIEIQKLIEDRFSYVYPHSILSKLYIKTTVSELKKMGQMNQEELGYMPLESAITAEDTGMVPYIPKFMQDSEQMSGTTRGSAYHKVLELLDLTEADTTSKIATQMDQLVQSGRLSKVYREAVREERIAQFATTSLAQRMAAAEKRKGLFREQPFVLGVAANQIQPEFPAEETILVQGIIDVYFEEDGELVVADYKTDQVTSGAELWNRYRTQLDYYADALERLTGKQVKEKIIYSFALGKEFQ